MTDESIFAAAIAIPSSAERAAFLDRACAGNPDLRRDVEALLAAHADSNPLDRPPGLAPTAAHEPQPGADTPGSPSAAVGDRVGSYKLLEKIGEGGMGEVWVAEQTEPIRRRVALKLIKPGMDSRGVLARFEAERQALAVMDHPNIARVLDAGTTDLPSGGRESPVPDGSRGTHVPRSGVPFFVMELVKGVPITEFCDARRLTPRQRLELFVPVCQAIQHAHMKGIIHRDIKPSNVLVALHDETPVPKVIDFGVAKAIGQQLTEKTLYTGFGALVGTPAYMAPEQATFNQLDVDTRADVYALGVLLYELLAGSPPVEPQRLKKAALDEVLRIVREEEPPRPSQRLSTSEARASIAATRQTEPAKLSKLLQGEIDWIVMKALEKDRARRYDTANALAKDVQRYLTGDAVEACPPTLGYRLRKFYRRNRTAVWVAMAFVGLVSGAAVMGATLAVQARRAEAEAERRREEAERERDRAWAAEQRAAEEAAVANEGLRFFQPALNNRGVFLEADGARDVDPRQSVTEFLGGIERRIPEVFRGRPLHEARIRLTLGMLYYGSGHGFAGEKALEHLTRAAALFEQELGTESPDALLCANLLAAAFAAEGREGEAIERFERLSRTLERLHGPHHLDTLYARNNLACVYIRVGRRAEALAIWEGFLTNPHVRAHLETSDRLSFLYNWVYTLEADRQYVRAAVGLREIVQLKQSETTDPINFNGDLIRLGRALLWAGQTAEAERVLREAVPKIPKLVTHPDEPYAQCLLGGILLDQLRYDEAEPLLLKGYQGLMNWQEDYWVRKNYIPETLDRLVALYSASGRSNEAMKWRTERAKYPFFTPPPREATR